MHDTLVVGGGIAGLATAALLARNGEDVVVLEGSKHLGGRARTQEEHGFKLNLGPHALYCVGPARAVLDDLGVRYAGKKAPVRGRAIYGGTFPLLPITPWSWMRSTLLTASERAELARWFLQLGVTRPESFRGTPLATVLAEVGAPLVRQVLAALFRLSTYVDDPEHLDAEAALSQLQRALHGVLYLDGGWQTLVDGLATVARHHGAEIRTGTAVLSARDGRVVTHTETLHARRTVLALPPKAAARLTESPFLTDHAARCRPVHAACLDLALREITPSSEVFALGIDHPTYYSVHSATAQLAPDGGAVLHGMAAVPTGGDADPRADLEALVDGLQPGWRERVVHERYLPRLTVSHDMPVASRGGLAGRAPVQVPDRADTFVVGDWVGGEAMLLDAALASARQVATLLQSQRSAA